MPSSVPETQISKAVMLTLSVKERLSFSQVLPEYGTIRDMKVIIDIEKKVELGEKEAKEIAYQEIIDERGKPTGRARWDGEKEKPLEVEFSGVEIEFLKRMVNKMSGEGRIKRDIAELCIKIDDLKKGG